MNPPLPGFLAFFPALDSLFTISPIVVLSLTGIALATGIILALLFEYHWKAYGVDRLEILRVRFWYYIGSVAFGGGMLVTALWYALDAM